MITGSLSVLYEDEDFIAVDKPAELLVHKTELSTDKTAALQIVRNQIGQHVYPVHRLDRATSGVLLFGKTPEAHKYASQQFSEKTVKKTYLALVKGWPAEERGEITSPLKKENGQEQEACTGYQTLLQVDYPYSVKKYPTSRYALLRLFPETGRRHQIRRHVRRLCGPIIGDTTYGEGAHNRFFREHFALPNLFLFAESLIFQNCQQKEITAKADLPESFTKIVEIFDWNIRELAT